MRIGVIGPGADDHKALYTYTTFAEVFESAGFEVRLHEYFDEAGSFHYQEWDPQAGTIWRSMRFDQRNQADALTYTSIVLDAVKTEPALA